MSRGTFRTVGAVAALEKKKRDRGVQKRVERHGRRTRGVIERTRAASCRFSSRPRLAIPRGPSERRVPVPGVLIGSTDAAGAQPHPRDKAARCLSRRANKEGGGTRGDQEEEKEEEEDLIWRAASTSGNRFDLFRRISGRVENTSYVLSLGRYRSLRVASIVQKPRQR